MDILKKRHKVVWAAFASLYNALDKVMFSEHLEDRDDSKVLADLEMLREKADDLSKLDVEVMDLLLRADVREEDMDTEMQKAYEYAS
jgi:hypothetical protein